ncbi:MAG: adenosylcobinamide-GDP ribazoletransferase [Lachnospiraceae bacterium]|nr:adenosylcobinamide-GDP ribazoletransferase [Lachnospiraceae bacterium]
MSLIKACVIAFSMYSKIPVPQFAWKDKDMRYVMFFFPWVGIVIGAVTMLWAWVADHFTCGRPCFVLIGVAIPLLLSGGIHVDGFLDTMDAFHSYQDREKKLEILQDPHIGAGSVISLVLYYLIFLAAFTQLNRRDILALMAAGYYLSRILSAIGVVTLKCAKTEGLLYLFADKAQERVVKTGLYVQLVLCAAFMLWQSLLAGGVVLLGGIATFFYYRYRSYRELGGITGDTAGYFVTVCEGVTAVLLAVLSVV